MDTRSNSKEESQVRKSIRAHEPSSPHDKGVAILRYGEVYRHDESRVSRRKTRNIARVAADAELIEIRNLSEIASTKAPEGAAWEHVSEANDIAEDNGTVDALEAKCSGVTRAYVRDRRPVVAKTRISDIVGPNDEKEVNSFRLMKIDKNIVMGIEAKG